MDGMLREEASKEKLGFESIWDSAAGAGAESGKRGKSEDELVEGNAWYPPPAESAAVAVVGGECSGEGSMAACENRECLGNLDKGNVRDTDGVEPVRP